MDGVIKSLHINCYSLKSHLTDQLFGQNMKPLRCSGKHLNMPSLNENNPSVTLHHKMMGCYPESCRMILDEERIHKYIHTNHILSVLNIKYYKFNLNFDT
jgi:formamidopyrimidine-DNA glycosylase